jgi:3-deoxy-D-manno-octulosonic-acid transferase
VVQFVVMALYSLLLMAVLVLGAPYWLARMATSGRYRAGLAGRLGIVPAELRAAIAGRQVVWVHAVSVGEVLAATRLVAELEAALVAKSGAGWSDSWSIVVSTTTATGQALARERFGAGRVFWYPLDLAWAVRAYLRVLKPRLLVLMESELWPRMLVECGRAGVPVAVVNARVSDRSFTRGVRVKAVWGWVLRRVNLFLAQSEEDGRRLVAMGARAEAVRVVGNLKYDVRAPKASRVAELIQEAAGGRPIVVAGSTVHGEPRDEDSYVIHAWEGTARTDKNALLVLAPRHPARFQHVYEMALEFPTLKATELLNGKRSVDAFSIFTEAKDNHGVEIVVLDTIGDLAAVYGIADVAFVGGSLVRKGGHNPLEPAQFGVPVVMGPSFENFRDIVENMRSADAISVLDETVGTAIASSRQVAYGRDPKLVLKDKLEGELVELLTDREAARAMGERGRAVFEAQSGATGRAVEALVGLVWRDDEVAP